MMDGIPYTRHFMRDKLFANLLPHIQTFNML